MCSVDDQKGNLNGSVSTTDCYCGADCCYAILNSRMQFGLVSRSGWSVVDDTATELWDDATEWRWRRLVAARGFPPSVASPRLVSRRMTP